MALSDPYALAFLADILPITAITPWGVHRNDELSGTGDARVWPAELADPLWTTRVTLEPMSHNQAKQIAAKIRKLYGAQGAFLLYDPLSKYPQSDPDGSIVTGSTVLVHTIGSENKSLRLKGLPVGYVLTIGDKIQIAYASTKSYFGEVSETVTADGSGITPEFEVFPHVPVGLAADDAVTLIKPACKVFIMPGSFNLGSASGVFTEGMSFTAMERRR